MAYACTLARAFAADCASPMCCSATFTDSIKSSITVPLYISSPPPNLFPGQHRNGGIKAVEFSPYFVREDDATPEPLAAFRFHPDCRVKLSVPSLRSYLRL